MNCPACMQILDTNAHFCKNCGAKIDSNDLRQTNDIEVVPICSNSDAKPCPFCAELIKREAVKCKHCGQMLGEGCLAGSLAKGRNDTSQSDTKTCKYCSEKIHIEAEVCRYCKREQFRKKPEGQAFDESNAASLYSVIAASDYLGALELLSTAQQISYQAEVDRCKKSTGVAYLLWILLGWAGGHKFYLGERGWGLAYLCAYCFALSVQLLVFGSFFIVSFKPLSGGWAAFVGLTLYFIAGGFVVGALFLDMFLLPSQVTRANDRVRLRILTDICRRLSPHEHFSGLVKQSMPFSVCVGVVTALLVPPVLLVLFLISPDKSVSPTSSAQEKSGTVQTPVVEESVTTPGAAEEERGSLTAAAVEDEAVLVRKVLQNVNDDYGFQDALTRLQSSTQVDPGAFEKAERFNEAGLQALKAKEYTEAVSAFKAASDAEPSNAKYFSNLGFAELYTGELDAAKRHLHRSLALAPARGVAWSNLGLVLAKENEEQLSVAALLASYKLSSEHSLVYLESLLTDESQQVRNAAKVAIGNAKPWQAPASSELPTRLGQSCITRIKEITSRLEGVPDSGDAVLYENGGYQVSYGQIPGLSDSKVNDEVEMCLTKLPRQFDGTPCPDGDDRGRIYRVTNLRTRKTWEVGDSQHCCGGA